jgi:hypothetical protein
VGGTTEILPTLPDISDHVGMVLHFNDELKKQKLLASFFNKGLLTNLESKTSLLATWQVVMEDNTINSWNQKMVAANKAIRLKSEELTKQHKRKWKDIYLAKFDEINEAEAALQHKWGSRRHRINLVTPKQPYTRFANKFFSSKKVRSYPNGQE